VRKEVPQLEIWNKIDLMPEDLAEAARTRALRDDTVLTLSALTGEGIDNLLETLTEKLREAAHHTQLSLTFAQGKKRAWLFAQELVTSETQSEIGFEICVTWSAKQEKQFNDI
jgi:GTP-binding protein HflX